MAAALPQHGAMHVQAAAVSCLAGAPASAACAMCMCAACPPAPAPSCIGQEWMAEASAERTVNHRPQTETNERAAAERITLEEYRRETSLSS